MPGPSQPTENRRDSDTPAGSDRREFLQASCAVPLGMAAVGLANTDSAKAGPAGEANKTPTALPQVPFGRHRISRLVIGGNPFNGGSHMSFMVSNPMKEYFTPEKCQWVLHHAAELGINTWQSSGNDIERWSQHRELGGKLQYISLEARAERIPELVQRGAIGIAHHGELTDRLFKTGKIDQVREFLKRVRDSGVQVGLSTHMPAVIDYVEEKGWDLDYYMACVFERHRSREQLQQLLGDVPIPVPEVYLEGDPPRMHKAIRQTSRTCLAFKILAAGRLCNRKGSVERAFKTTFEGIKPTDAVIVGMYPRYSDQVAENVAFTRKYG